MGSCTRRRYSQLFASAKGNFILLNVIWEIYTNFILLS